MPSIPSAPSPGPTFDLAEVRADLAAAAAQLRAALPIVVTVAGADESWPDTLLTDVIHDVAASIHRLDAAAGLLTSHVAAADQEADQE